MSKDILQMKTSRWQVATELYRFLVMVAVGKGKRDTESSWMLVGAVFFILFSCWMGAFS